MDVLLTLAEHNAWANARVFAACAAVPEVRLRSDVEEYDSAFEILLHLVHVETNFLALAQGRERTPLATATLAEAADACARVDQAYIEHARTLDPARADSERFLVPWFGFEVSLAEGILQPMTHSHKHRSDVSMILPLLGGEGVEMDLIQWIAESRAPAD